MTQTTTQPGATERAQAGIKWVLRPYAEDDIPAIVKLLNAAYTIDAPEREISVEELTASFGQPLSDPPRQVVVAEGPRVEGVPGGELLGYGRIMNRYDEETAERLYQMELRLHPGARNTGLDRALAARLVEIAWQNERLPETTQAPNVYVLAAARDENLAYRALLEGIGLAPVRHGWIMERLLSEPLPEPSEVEGVTARGLSLPEDNARTLDAFNNSFLDHYGFHTVTPEIWNYMLENAHIRADLSWLAESEVEPGTAAGFCLCEVNDAENEHSGHQEGWIAFLGTVRAWRGKGLGRSLLLRGLHSLKSAGMETALLGVDSESPTGANRLYESVGFTVKRHETVYRALLGDLKV